MDALPLLFVDLSTISLAKIVDWGYWKEAFVEYNPVKDRLSKEIPPEVVAAQYSAVKFPSGSGNNDALTAMARLIRSKHYSIRTEQTYLALGIEVLGVSGWDAGLFHPAKCSFERDFLSAYSGVGSSQREIRFQIFEVGLGGLFAERS